MKSSTEILRRLLDERGVEYELTAWSCGAAVWWRDSSGAMWRAHDNEIDELLSLYAWNSLTPEQAVEATLGRGTCHPIISDNLTESEGTGDAWADCSECGHLLFVLTDPNSTPPNYCSNCGRRVVE